MTRQEVKKLLEDRGYKFSKLVFHEKSPYQSRRYKPEFVGWEAWLYNGKSKVGFLILQSEIEMGDEQYQRAMLEAFNN
jgi:hypothetical protein